MKIGPRHRDYRQNQSPAFLELSHNFRPIAFLRRRLIKMCEDCRVAFVAEHGFESYDAPSPTVRTTDNYLRERDAKALRPPEGNPE